jgi:hypothetical protein
MERLRLSGPARSGDVLGGRYRLEELIGEGGMGSVWRAADTALGRTAAVKVFWSGSGDGGDAARRESEKKLLAAVSHPSLVTLFDAHLSNDGLSYLVMEYIDGGTLSSLISRGPVAPRDAASLATDLGEALHVVHQAGIIHRDIKPANILLRPPLTEEHTFRAVLADFGIAYVVDAARVTTPGMTIGTAAYISPEQVRGHAPTPASDIYSLGLVLLEALSGTRAFSAQTPVKAISVRLTAAPQIPGDWGYGWRSLLSAMTALDPDARPTALEVARRGRELDSPESDAAETSPVPLATGDAREHTKLLIAPAPVASTTVARDAAAERATRDTSSEGEETALLSQPGGGIPVGRRAMRPRREAATRRRRRGVVAGAVAGVAALAVALAVWGGVAASAPAQAPQVEVTDPAEPEPLLTVGPASEPTTEPADTEPAVTDPALTDPGTSGGTSGTEPGTGPANENSGPGNNNGSGPDDNSGGGNGKGNGKSG